MKIFITGATGFIGTHLTRQLVKENHKVTALLRTESKRKLLPDNVQIIKGDLSIFKDKELKLPEFDVVIHLAGTIFAKNDQKYYEGNCQVTKDLITCLENQDWTLKRFLYASSLAAAGPSFNGHVMDESDQPNPIDPYGKAKLAAERYLSRVKSFPITCFRPAIVLGPGDWNSLSLFKMAKWGIGMNVDGQPQKLSFIDVTDLNDAIVKMMTDPSPENKIYFVAHSKQITNNDLFLALGKVMNKKVSIIPLPKIVLKLAMQTSSFVTNLLQIKNQLDKKQYDQLINDFECSSALLQKELHWTPQFNLNASLKKAYVGYVEMGML
ncbi:MAG: NAD(P)-dependent oxidoreductase [Chitinophagales bacterium]